MDSEQETKRDTAGMILFVCLFQDVLWLKKSSAAEKSTILYQNKFSILKNPRNIYTEQTQKNTQQKQQQANKIARPLSLVLQLLLLLLLLFLPRPALPTIININARPFVHSLQFISLNRYRSKIYIFKYFINRLSF